MKKGMTKVSVSYPNGAGKKFDMDYYCNQHMPLVRQLLGDALKGSSVEKGLGGATPGSPAPNVCVGVMYYDSPQAFGEAFGPHAKEILGDLPNFTDIEPVVQVSEVIM